MSITASIGLKNTPSPNPKITDLTLIHVISKGTPKMTYDEKSLDKFFVVPENNYVFIGKSMTFSVSGADIIGVLFKNC